MTMLTFDKTQIIRNRILEFSGEKTKATFLKKYFDILPSTVLLTD